MTGCYLQASRVILIRSILTFQLFQAFYESNYVDKGELEVYKQELEAKVCERSEIT